MISVVSSQFFNGPNVHTDHSVLRLVLKGSGLDVLAAPLPQGHGALAGAERLLGGEALLQLVERSRTMLEPTAYGFDLALAIAEKAQADYALQPARGWSEPAGDGKLAFYVPADNPFIGRTALQLGGLIALDLALAPDVERANALIAAHQNFISGALQTSPDMLTLAIARCAVANDIPAYPLDIRPPMIQLGQGQYGRLMMETVLEPQTRHADALTRDKWATRCRLAAMGLPVLPGALAASADQAAAAARTIDGPAVVKPVKGGKGIGISLMLTTEEQVRRAYDIAAKRNPAVLVELYGAGEDHRVTVLDGRMLAAAKRVPATIIGDGKQTVRQLLAALNADPRRGSIPYEKLMERVPLDARLDTLLSQQGLSLDAVPADGVTVKVTLAANVSQGGTAIDVTDRVHPDNRAAIEAAARACRARVAGVDFLSPDISRSWREGKGWILEVNTSCGLRPHWIAAPDHDIVTPILRSAFPEGVPSRVPSVAVTGGEGSAVCQMLAQIARHAGRFPAVSTAQGTWLGTSHLKAGDCATGVEIQALLADTATDCAFAELASDSLRDAGMAVDGFDAVAVLGAGDGVEIPVRTARQWVFFDADDAGALALRASIRDARVALVSLDQTSPALAEHRAAGGRTVAAEGPNVVVRDGEDLLLTLPLVGRDRDAVFAVGIELTLGFAPDAIAAGLASAG